MHEFVVLRASPMELTRIRGYLTLRREEETTIPKSRPPYAPGQQMIELVQAGRTPESLSREFEPIAQTIHNWIRQAERDEGHRADGVSSTERECEWQNPFCILKRILAILSEIKSSYFNRLRT